MTNKDKNQCYVDLLGKIDTLDIQVSRIKDQLSQLKTLIMGPNKFQEEPRHIADGRATNKTKGEV
jgi:hypothetical protein